MDVSDMVNLPFWQFFIIYPKTFLYGSFIVSKAFLEKKIHICGRNSDWTILVNNFFSKIIC